MSWSHALNICTSGTSWTNRMKRLIGLQPVLNTYIHIYIYVLHYIYMYTYFHSKHTVMYWALAWDNQSKLSGFEEPNPFPASRMGTGLRSCESRVALHQDLSIRCKRSLDIVLDFQAWQARASWWRVSAPVQVNITHLVKVFCNGRCPCYKVWVKRWNKWWNRERDRERERPRVAAKHIAAKCTWFFDLHIFMAEAQKPLAPCGCISRCHLSTGGSNLIKLICTACMCVSELKTVCHGLIWSAKLKTTVFRTYPHFGRGLWGPTTTDMPWDLVLSIDLTIRFCYVQE